MAILTREGNRLVRRNGRELLWIEPWGANSLRVRATCLAGMPEQDWALLPQPEQEVAIAIEGEAASITCGGLTARLNREGWLSFTNARDEVLLTEYWRNRDDITRYSVPLALSARQMKRRLGSDDFALTARFEARADEKLFGMGQYQDSELNKKGCTLELAQRNSQASVPFCLSNLGYGFLWNNPAVGQVTFAANRTEWTLPATRALDYWVTAGDTPAQIEGQYADATGHVPMMPDYGMGFWQCKLRYRTQEELLNVAREHKRRGLPMDVIVVDFFHWPMQGEWRFDPIDWPDPDAMVRELKEMGIELMVSIWPTVDARTENYRKLNERGLLIGVDRGTPINMNWMGETLFYDATNPEAQRFVWNEAKKNYFERGIRIFWLDEAEPEGIYDFDLYRFHLGPAQQVSNIYPNLFAKGFYDGMTAEGMDKVLNLVRCVWAGGQRYGALAWSGDIYSSFRTLREQLQAGLSMAIAGIPWWTTDIGGFLGGDIHDPHFHELLVRWFQWGAFCPVMRLHGERPPFKPMVEEWREGGVRQFSSGQDNEVWSFGEDVYEILVKYLHLRERLRPYIARLMADAHGQGAPVMRPMFYDFPAESAAWEVADQYMLGPDLLVAPVMEEGVRSRTVWLPAGCGWRDARTGERFSGGQTATVPAPLDVIPVFVREGSDIRVW